MKYLPLRDFEDVTSALNFTTPDCHVVGGCDLYTTKAAGSDKKLYKSIENTLETQHASLLRLSASLSPPQQESLADSLNLSRSSPFGPLSQISSRRTFAYLIATLNASHPDYDFSHVLRPADFRRERSLRGVMHTLDTTLSNLRPSTLVSSPSSWSSGPIPSGLRTPGGSTTWGPRMWRLIDAEMDLRKCSVYAYAPEEDPFDGDEGAVWRMDYFFFNKERKRVCYMYLRGLSVISHSPVLRPMGTPKRTRSGMGGMSEPTTPMTSGARKRARYWLGERADGDDVEGGWGEDDEDAGIIAEPGDDEVDVDDITLDLRDVEVERRRAMSMAVSSDEEEDAEDEDEEDDLDVVRQEQKQHRAMSETMADEMEF